MTKDMARTWNCVFYVDLISSPLVGDAFSSCKDVETQLGFRDAFTPYLPDVLGGSRVWSLDETVPLVELITEKQIKEKEATNGKPIAEWLYKPT